jgi:hypothetical protein
LEEPQILVCLREADLEVREAIHAEELERGLHSSDGLDLSAELDNVRTLTDRIPDKRTTKARRLS